MNSLSSLNLIVPRLFKQGGIDRVDLLDQPGPVFILMFMFITTIENQIVSIFDYTDFRENSARVS